MPGMKHMNQDRPVDGQDTLQTMQDKKSGIYQDRTEGKLPQDRVAKYYQESNPKMEQDAIQNLKNVGEGFKYGANSLGSAVSGYASSAADAVKSSTLGKVVGATYDYLSGQKEKEANEHQNKYNEKRKQITGGKK